MPLVTTQATRPTDSLQRTSRRPVCGTIRTLARDYRAKSCGFEM